MTNSPNTERKYLTRQEAAQYLGVSVATLARWAIRQHGPAYYQLGRDAKYRKEDLDAFLSTNRRLA